MNLYRQRLRITLLGALIGLPCVSAALNYTAKMNEANWMVEGSELECRLHQAIPAFGRATFTRQAAGSVVFHLDSYERPVSEANVYLVAEAPAWKPASFDAVLGAIDTLSTNKPVEIMPPMADRLLAHLQEGRSPVFSDWPWYQGEPPIDVGISAVNFMPAYREYQQCLAGLLDLDFDELSTSLLNFDTDKYELSPAGRERLKVVAQILKADPTIEHCYIDGYTDDIGTSRYNMDLSRRRAEEVEFYLVQQGIDASRITTRFHGEANWISNPVLNEKARAENRRVTVRLKKEP